MDKSLIIKDGQGTTINPDDMVFKGTLISFGYPELKGLLCTWESGDSVKSWSSIYESPLATSLTRLSQYVKWANFSHFTCL